MTSGLQRVVQSCRSERWEGPRGERSTLAWAAGVSCSSFLSLSTGSCSHLYLEGTWSFLWARPRLVLLGGAGCPGELVPGWPCTGRLPGPPGNLGRERGLQGSWLPQALKVHSPGPQSGMTPGLGSPEMATKDVPPNVTSLFT